MRFGPSAFSVLLATSVGCDDVFDLEYVAKSDATVVGAACPDTFDLTLPSQTSRYRLDFSPRTYIQHEAICGEIAAPRTHLVTAETTSERDAIRKRLSQQPAGEMFWVGLTQRDSTEVADGWWWLTGVEASASIWVANEPDDDAPPENGQQQHAVIEVADLVPGEVGLVNDRNDGNEFFAMCECEAR